MRLDANRMEPTRKPKSPKYLKVKTESEIFIRVGMMNRNPTDIMRKTILNETKNKKPDSTAGIFRKIKS